MTALLLGFIVGWAIMQNPTSDGAQIAYIGMAMNFVAVASNGWQMPVFAPDITEKQIKEKDPFMRHKVGDEKTNFKLLCDWLDFGFMIASPGDLLMFYGAFMNLTNQFLVITPTKITLKYQFVF